MDEARPFPRRIGLYDAYLDTLGGGENFLAVFAELLEHEYPRSEIEIITHGPTRAGVQTLCKRFGVSLERTRVRRIPLKHRSRLVFRGPIQRFFHETDIARISEGYDLFVNNTVFSVAPSRSPQSIYMCMFPLSPEPWQVRDHPTLQRLSAPYTAIRRLLYHRWIGSYSFVLANSEFTREWIQRIWRLDSRVLYPPIETKESLDLRSKIKNILAIGRFFPGNHNKKHDVLIDVFRSLRRKGLGDWQLHLVGGKTRVPGTEEYIASLRTRAAGLPVFFHIDASREELDRLLRQSAIFWHATGHGERETETPEKLEHFGMSTVEAMSNGCVPLVYSCGGQPEIIEHGRSGYLWREQAELEARTLEVVSSQSQREALARNAHERSQRFSRDAFREAARAILHDLQKAAGPSP